MMASQKTQFGTAQGRTDLGHGKTQVPTLAELGIGKHLADRARKLRAMYKEEKERLVAEGCNDVYRSIERAIISKINRREKHKKLSRGQI
jgi:hypothetical protein